MTKDKGGRPLGSGEHGVTTLDRKAYDKVYRTKCRYIFSVNLSQEKDADIIEALEGLAGGNRQKAVKILIRKGILHNKIMSKCLETDKDNTKLSNIKQEE